MSVPGLVLHGQPVQLSDVLTRLNIEDRISTIVDMQAALDRDAELITKSRRWVPTCFVCGDPFEKTNHTSVVILLTGDRRCGHVFHAACVSERVVRDAKCPMCGSANVTMCSVNYRHEYLRSNGPSL
jgi:hypothetical protein